MHIGKHELNKNEEEWCIKFAKDFLFQAHSKCVSDLNKKLSEEDVAGLLHFLWTRSPTVVSNDEAEDAEIEAAQAETDETYE